MAVAAEGSAATAWEKEQRSGQGSKTLGELLCVFCVNLELSFVFDFIRDCVDSTVLKCRRESWGTYCTTSSNLDGLSERLGSLLLDLPQKTGLVML